MRKTTVAVDDAKLAEVRDVLGTRGTTDTIDAALTEVLVAAARRREIQRLRTGDGMDFPDFDRLRAQMWRR